MKPRILILRHICGMQDEEPTVKEREEKVAKTKLEWSGMVATLTNSVRHKLF